MKTEELKKLTNIFEAKNEFLATYNYASFIPDAEVGSKKYYPTFFREDVIYDYTRTARAYLRRKSISYYPHETFVRDSRKSTLTYDINNLTLEEAQLIINRNIALFSQIQEKVAQDQLIAELSRI